MPVVRIESSSAGEIPALLKAMSTRPYSSAARWNSAFTCSSSATSTLHEQAADLARRLCPRVGVDVGAHDPRTLGGEAPGRRQTDAAAGAGDHRYLAVETSGHGHSFVEMKTFLVSVNANGASGPSSRPRPEDLKPPNGVQ